MALQKSQHFTDFPIVGNRIRRRISNWLNYQEPNRDWKESTPIIEQAVSIPDNWEGAFDFQYQSLKGPIQAFVGDSTDVLNTALVGVRCANKPECWINYKALGVNNSVGMKIFPVQRAVRWPDLWTNTDLAYQVGRHKLDKQIKLKDPGHPVSFRFAFRIPAGMSYEIVNNQLLLRDEFGEVVLRSFSPWGEDSSTTAPTDNGKQAINVTMVESDPVVYQGKTFPTLLITPDLADLSGATYPVIIDPTTQITGTTDIEDNSMNSASPGNNRGSKTDIWTIANRRPLCRIATIGSIPEGTITALRLHLYSAGSLATLEAFAVKDGNDWVEGTAFGAVQAGSSCWSHAKYDTQSWLGSAGCNTSGTDYDADGSPPSITLVDAQFNAWTLKAAWATAWRDATREPNGIVINYNPIEWGNYWASEHGTYPCYWEVDYDEGGVSMPVFMNHYRQMGN